MFKLHRSRIMLRRCTILSILLSTILTLLISACKPPDDCCKQYDEYSSSSTYCNNHRRAAYDFALVVSSTESYPDSLSAERLTLLKSLLDQIKDCGDVACIESKIDQNANLAEFREHYDVQHADSEPADDLGQKEKADLMRCGFYNAIKDIEAGIKQQEGQ